MRWGALIMLLLSLALPARAEQVVAGLSQARVQITANFAGSEILIFGAVKREAPVPEGAPLHVIVTVAGPSKPVTVRRKERRFGIWVNTEAADIAAAPTFYSIASTGPLADILLPEEDSIHSISVPRSIRRPGVFRQVGDAPAFVDALIRIREGEGQYKLREGVIDLTEDTLFRTAVRLPANLTEGDYEVRFFLTRGGEVIDDYHTAIPVRKVGLERWIYNLAHDLPLVYGLLSLAVAIGAGWGASAAFRFFQA